MSYEWTAETYYAAHCEPLLLATCDTVSLAVISSCGAFFPFKCPILVPEVVTQWSVWIFYYCLSLEAFIKKPVPLCSVVCNAVKLWVQVVESFVVLGPQEKYFGFLHKKWFLWGTQQHSSLKSIKTTVINLSQSEQTLIFSKIRLFSLLKCSTSLQYLNIFLMGWWLEDASFTS